MSVFGAYILGVVLGLIIGFALGVQIGKAALDEAEVDIRRIQAADRSCESRPM